MKSLFCIILLFLPAVLPLYAQDITGNWYSKDGSRQYRISEKENGWEAIVVNSKRPDDREGRLVISQLHKQGSKYRGIIHAVNDEQYTTVTLKAGNRNNQVLVLKLKRMLVLDVTIRWYRDPTL